MRILYLSDSFYSRSETFRRDLVRGLRDARQEVRVLSDTLGEDFDQEFASITTVARWLSLPRGLQTIRNRLLTRLGSGARAHTEALVQGMRNRALARALGTQRFDAAFIDYGTIAAAAMDMLRMRSIPLIVHFHGFDATTALRDAAYASRLPQLFSEARAILTPSQHLKRLLILLGADREKIHVVKLGVDAGLVAPMPWNERTQLEPSVVFLGRLTPKKNPVALIEAFALVRRPVPLARLTIIGDGPERERVERRISRHGLEDSVRMLGSLPQRAALAEVNRHWIFAHHSVTPITGDQESFGLSMAEAAALALPVVATLHNGIPEHVTDGVTGYLVPEYDFETMAEKISFLLRNPEEAERLGAAGRAHILAEYSPASRIARISAIIADVVRSTS